jgi:hypothetical protein
MLNQNSNVSLPIYVNNKLSRIFVKAHAELIKKNKFNNQQLSIEEKKEMLENLWFTEYFVKIIKENNNWKYLLFNTNHELTVFCLRWS